MADSFKPAASTVAAGTGSDSSTGAPALGGTVGSTASGGNASSTGPPLPPGFTAAEFAALRHDNIGPRLVVVIWILIVAAFMFMGLRLYCKATRARGLWWDDWVLLASWICITVESCLLTYAVAKFDYGHHIYDAPAGELQFTATFNEIIFSAGSLTLTAAVWSKTSFALTLLRLTDGWMRKLVWFIIVSMNIAMGLSAIIPWVECTPVEKSWNFTVEGGSCWPTSVLVDYDIFSAAYSAAMDITLAMLPWKLIWGLQMRPREKIGVAIAMSCGVFAGITAIVKTSKIPELANMDNYHGVDLFIWGNAESCVTIIAASIPVLRVLFRDVRATTRRNATQNTRGYTPGRSGANTRGGHAHPGHELRSQTHEVRVTGGRSRHTDSDDWSVKSMLDNRRSNGIIQTSEVEVEYRRKQAGEEQDYVMNHLVPV